MPRRNRVSWLPVVLGLAVAASAQSPRPTFEVASIRRHAEFIPPVRMPASTTVFRSPNATVVSLVQWAYDIGAQQQVIGGPEWIREDLFEIVAKSATETTTEQMRLMVRSLLAERFGLVVRPTRQEMRAFQMVLANGDRRHGPALEPFPDPAAPPPVVPVRIPPGADVRMLRCVAIARVAEVATNVMRTVVVDETGLTGAWTYVLSFARAQPLAPGRERDLAALEPPPSFQDALREQLGLKLEPRRAPVDVLLIESVRQPVED